MKSFILTLAFCAGSGAFSTAAEVPAEMPGEVPIARYQAMVEKSPFALATPQVAPVPVTPTASFAQDLYVSGMAQLGMESFVAISSKDHLQHYGLTVGETSDGITLTSVEWGSEVGKGKATLKKGSEYAVIGFDEAVQAGASVPQMPQPPPPNQMIGAAASADGDSTDDSRRTSTPADPSSAGTDGSPVRRP